MARTRLKRGDLVTAVLSGDYGKPRPTVIVQSDRLANLGSIPLCPLTTDIDAAGPARILVERGEANELRHDSLVMGDKITAVSLSRCQDGWAR